VATVYTSALGYGWQGSGGIAAADRGSGADPTTRHLNSGGDKTFLVDLPNGVYNVIPTLGDATAPTMGVALWIDGKQVRSNINTLPGRAFRGTYRVVVSDGQLALRLAGQRSGLPPYFAINSLEIDPAAPPPGQVLTVSAGSSFSGDEGASLIFNGAASGGVTPYTIRWAFGDGSSATGSLHPAHSYADDGSYTAQLTVSDSSGQTKSSSVLVTVNNVPPTVSLSGPSGGVPGSPLRFSASATDPSPSDTAAGFTFLWDFGDGATGTGASTSHAYATSGPYIVSVTARDKDGEVSQPASKLVTISGGIGVSAGANFSSQEGTSNTFHGSVSGGIAPFTYHWDFGDGSTADGSLTPWHVYPNNGTYVATLTVTDARGLSGANSLVATIADVPPSVRIAGPAASLVGSPCAFVAPVSDPSPEEMARGFSYSWNFGDGTTSTAAQPTHFFGAAGAYTVSVTVAAQDGSVGTASQVVNVSSPAATAYTLTQPYPASGSAGAASGSFTVALPPGRSASAAVTITPSDGGAGGSFSPAQVVLSGVSPTATFTYTPNRVGQIAITTTNNQGLSDPAPAGYFVVGPMTFDFGTAGSPVASGYTRVSGATSYAPSQGYGWVSGQVHDSDRGVPDDLRRDFCYSSDATFAVDLPNGAYSVTLTSGDATYAHDQAGIYVQGNLVDTITTAVNQWVTHTYQVTIANGQLDLRLKYLGGVAGAGSVINGLAIQAVDAPPTVNAGAPMTSYEGQPVTFAGSAAGTGTLAYHWDYGDGGSGDGTLSPTHVYANPGSYTATLTATDSRGIGSRSTVSVAVSNLGPSVSATGPASGTTGSSLTFAATASDPGPADQSAGFAYTWDFGDGTSGTGASPAHSYGRDGFYVVKVTATDRGGAAGMATTMIDVFRPGAPNDHTASYYNVTPPGQNFGLVNSPSSTITVSLPAYRYVSGPVIVTPGDGGAGGTFNPASLVLTNASPTASFTYTPARTGTIVITTTNSAGLADPASFTYMSWNPVTTYTMTGPSAADLGTTSTFTVTLGDGLLVNPVTITPAASDGDGTFSPASVTLTNSRRTASFSYSATLWGARNISTTDNRGLNDPAALSFVSRVQLGSSGTAPSGNQAPDLGGFNFFTTGSWWQELGRKVSGDAIDPNSAALMAGLGSSTLRLDWSTGQDKGGNGIYGIPFNVVPQNQTLLPLTLGAYASLSDPGPVPFYANMSIESWYSASGLPPAPGQVNGDHHGLVMMRDDTTGGISRLYEYYNVESPAGTLGATNGSAAITGTGTYFTTALHPGDTITIASVPYQVQSIASDTALTLTTAYAGATASQLNWLPPTSEAGQTWQSSGGAQWDLTTGAPRPEGWSASNAGGLPIAPFQITYDQAVRGAINHPVLMAIPTGLSYNRFVWPGRSAVYTGSNSGGIPMGARLRLNDTWYQANRASFSPIVQAILDALHNYGGIVSDLVSSGLWISGSNDERWNSSDLAALAGIPDSAFEVLDNVQSPLSFSGPTSGAINTTSSFSVNFNIPADSNFASNVYMLYSSDGGSTWQGGESGRIDDTHRSIVLNFKPTSPGTYILWAKPILDWISPARITFTATAASPAASTTLAALAPPAAPSASVGVMAMVADSKAITSPPARSSAVLPSPNVQGIAARALPRQATAVKSPSAGDVSLVAPTPHRPSPMSFFRFSHRPRA
jgi:PKD repeat protein